MSEGLLTLQDAFAQATGELPEATGNEVEVGSPPADAEPAGTSEQADIEAQEPPDSEASSEKNPLDLLELEEEGDSPSGLDPTSEDFWSQTVEVEGLGNVTLQEMRDGYLRQADYTRKTQELASERKLAADAVEFYQSFKDDPQSFAAYLASKFGFDVGDSTQSAVKIWTPEEVETEVEKRLAEALETHPDVQAARQQAGIQAVNQEFGRLEEKYGFSFNEQNRIAILREAQRRNTTDLELVTEALMHRAQQLQRERQNVKSASARRPAAPPAGEDQSGKPRKPKTIAEAFEAARAELEDAVASAQ